MNRRHLDTAVLAAVAAVLAACSSTPPAPPQPPTQEPTTTPKIAVPDQARPVAREPRLTRLANGVAVSVREAPGDDAQIELGFLSGASFVAPGLAELATWALLEDGDASQGRPSLRQAIQRLGGTVSLQIGPMTTWLDLRVPGGKWQQALAAVQATLTAPSQSRHQLLRMRDDLVAARADEVRRQPLRAVARAMLLGDRSTNDYLRGLLDRDPGEVSLFQSRLLRPERAVLALEVPGDPAKVATALEKTDNNGIAAWRPAAPVPGQVGTIDRTFPKGAHWAPSGRVEPCKVGIVMLLPDLAINGPRTPDLLLLQCCLTMDGTGGRLEQVLHERGLGRARWHSEVTQTADSVALLLTAEMDAAEAARVWPLLDLARRSLRDVPPSPSELALAARRARLTASLGQLDSHSRLRADTNMQLRGQQASQVTERLTKLAQSGLDPHTVEDFLQLPTAVVVVGGVMPADAAGITTFELMPSGFAPAAVAHDATTAATAAPWLQHAIDAAGGQALVRRFGGFVAEARLVQEKAPEVTDTIEWGDAGALDRKRKVLGQVIATKLTGDSGVESLGDKQRKLTDAEVAQVRREFSRHPLALLAACARGELQFRAIAQRTVDDRQLMILEALGDRSDRLRIHVDTVSHLVRVVESWETQTDGSLAHVEDDWSDYRAVAGLRVPFHRLTVFDDGENRLETVFTSCEPRLRAP